MRVLVAEKCGFCPGVRNAIHTAEQVLAQAARPAREGPRGVVHVHVAVGLAPHQPRGEGAGLQGGGVGHRDAAGLQLRQALPQGVQMLLQSLETPANLPFARELWTADAAPLSAWTISAPGFAVSVTVTRP